MDATATPAAPAPASATPAPAVTGGGAPGGAPAGGTAPATALGGSPAPSTAPAAGSTGAEGAATQGTPGQSTTPPAAAPAPVELKLPEGWKADEATGKWTSAAQEMGLKSESAQKLFDLHVAGLKSFTDAARASQEAELSKWAEAAKSDKEFGGAQFNANVETAKRAVAKFGGEGLSKFLNESGLGNHPELIRAFYRAGRAIAEDSVAGNSSAPGGQVSDAERLRTWFPTMNQ